MTIVPKPCSRCGGLKEPGARRLCDACRQAATACVQCGAPQADGHNRPLCRACYTQRNIERETPLQLRDAHWLAAQYAARSATRIAHDVGCDPHTVLKWLDKHGIPRRSRSEANTLLHATGSASLGRNRQMVSGRGNAGPGAIRRLDYPDHVT